MIRREGGFALVMVVAMILMLSLGTMAVLSTARDTVKVADGITKHAQRMARADGAVMLALGHLRAGEPVPGQWQDIVLRVQKLETLVNVNTATPEQLLQILSATGRNEAEIWVTRILAQRDSFAASGVPWRLDARPIRSREGLADLLDVDVQDPVLTQVTTYPVPEEITPPVRIEARNSDGRILRQTVVIPAQTPRVLEWR